MSSRFVAMLIFTLGVLFLHEGTMAITGHGAAFGASDDRPGHHHDAISTGHGELGVLPMPCGAVRDVVPSLQRPVPEPQPVAAPIAAIALVRDGPERAEMTPGDQAPLAVRCRAVFQVYRI